MEEGARAQGEADGDAAAKAHGQDMQGTAVPVARKKEWLDDLLGSFDCCGPTRMGVSMTTHARRPTGSIKRGFSKSQVGEWSTNGTSAEASRSTIGPLDAGGPWEFDDASPNTWPDDITYTYLQTRPQQNNLDMLSEALVSETAAPGDFVKAGEHGSVERIADFVRQELQLGDKIFTLIHEEKIDAPVVLACSKEELTSLGVRKLGDQKRLTMFARAALAKDAAIDERRRDILEADLGSYPPKPQSLFSPAKTRFDDPDSKPGIGSLSPKSRPLLFF